MDDSPSAVVMPLHDRPEWIERIAAWHWREWGNTESGESKTQWRAIVAGRTDPEDVPFTLVAVVGEDPVACVSICWDDTDAAHAEAGPWVSGMYVEGMARNLGIGRALLAAAELRCRSLGYEELWLHTGEAHQFYERCGWTLIRPKSITGVDAVMRRRLIDPVR